MQCAAVRAAAAAPSFHFFSCPLPLSAAPKPKPFLHKTFNRRPHFRPFSVKMSSESSPIIEHIVLFKVKPDADPLSVNAMISNLNGLTSLDSVLYLTTGPVARSRSSSLSFTHMLHSRYKSKDDLATYTDHPRHVGVVADYVKPVIEDVMAVDWVSDGVSGPAEISPGSAIRVTFMKLKENAGENGKGEVLRAVKGIKEKFPSIQLLSCGENFSPARAKGFSIASIAVFKEMNELEQLSTESELANEQKDKVREYLDGVLVLDYAVPALQPASL